MKRYRIIQFDFDSRARDLSLEIPDSWEESAKQNHLNNVRITKESLIFEYGPYNYETKIKNFTDLGDKPFSVLAFHNRFFEEARTAFVTGAYYPCLTAVCALGERILNHLILLLRNDFAYTKEYKKVYRKESFDDWTLAINTLVAWEVLLPEVEKNYRELMGMRHEAIHFRPEADDNARELALEAFHCLKKIIAGQFSITTQPWILITRGEIYIKKDWEERPFVKRVYLPNCLYVGPLNKIVSLQPVVKIDDNFPYRDIEISDEQFRKFNIAREVPDEYLTQNREETR